MQRNIQRIVVYVDAFGGRYVVVAFDRKLGTASVLKDFGDRSDAETYAALASLIAF